jgi:hypothetical protein
MRLALALLCVTLTPALALADKTKSNSKPGAKKAAISDNWWRNFKNGKRISADLVYAGIKFPTEKCATRFGSSGKLTAPARRAFATCLSALLDRTNDPFELEGGWIDDLRVASSHEQGRLYATLGPQRDEDQATLNSVIHRVVFFDPALAKKFVRDNLPDIPPKARAIAAMKRDGITSISTVYRFCIDESGQTKMYGAERHSAFKEDWDFYIGSALSNWTRPFLVEGRGVAICDKIEFVYPRPSRTR